MNERKTQIDLRLLFLVTLAIFFAALTAYSAPDDEIPAGPNTIKQEVDAFFQPGILKEQLYAEGKIDAGSQGYLTREALEAGEVAVIRYGNEKASGGEFPYTSWATSEIQRLIHESLEEWGIDPALPDDKLTKEQKTEKARIIQQVRRHTGYTVGEQRQAILARQKELERNLTEKEIAELKQTYPLKPDPQTDEIEALIIVENATIYQLHKLFMDQNEYARLMPDYFLHAHLLTDEEVSKRNIQLRPGENLFYAHLLLDDTVLKYTVLNQWRLQQKEITLRTPEGNLAAAIPVIVTAWSLYEPFSPKLDLEKEFVFEGPYVISGYLTLEPYIETDANGYQSVSKSRIIAVYHTFTRPDELYKDLTGVSKKFRLAVGRRLVQTMIAKFKERLCP